MGLDITAYSSLVFVSAEAPEDFGGEMLYTIEGAESRLDEQGEGYYEFGENYDSFGFSAGSYSGYNWWRNLLCQCALGVSAETLWGNAEDFRGKPFFELINYPDNEGAIGSNVSAKLAADFEQNRELVLKNLPHFTPDTARFEDRYAKWERAFKLAAQGGAVVLH